ncbi:hypothetical protein ACFWGC_27635 [Cytobacillus pseudoceanisediminis]|uniref:hypothetical protein n=1 Tax=Cytobacillus pseudoceanisediminis TaxID=3051614 RepID=UPI003658F378
MNSITKSLKIKKKADAFLSIVPIYFKLSYISISVPSGSLKWATLIPHPPLTSINSWNHYAQRHNLPSYDVIERHLRAEQIEEITQ